MMAAVISARAAAVRRSSSVSISAARRALAATPAPAPTPTPTTQQPVSAPEAAPVQPPPQLRGWRYALAKGTAVSLGLETRAAVATRRAQTLYTKCASAAQQSGVFYIRTCALPNTFQTWFAVTQLHLWMCTGRLRRAGADGHAVARALVDAFIADVEVRMGQLQVARIDASLRTLVAQLYGMSLAYDEGIVGSDATLYAALWRSVRLRAAWHRTASMADLAGGRAQQPDRHDRRAGAGGAAHPARSPTGRAPRRDHPRGRPGRVPVCAGGARPTARKLTSVCLWRWCGAERTGPLPRPLRVGCPRHHACRRSCTGIEGNGRGRGGRPRAVAT
jgi:hypothetical protein